MFIKLGRKGIKNISFCVYILHECYFNLGCLTHHQHLTEASPPAPLRMERGVITEIPLLEVAPPPSPPRMERGVITEIPLHVLHLLSSPIGVTSHITPLPAGEGMGEGPPPHEFETVRKKGLLNL
mgnify:CR=1 FL=1